MGMVVNAGEEAAAFDWTVISRFLPVLPPASHSPVPLH